MNNEQLAKFQREYTRVYNHMTQLEAENKKQEEVLKQLNDENAKNIEKINELSAKNNDYITKVKEVEESIQALESSKLELENKLAETVEKNNAQSSNDQILTRELEANKAELKSKNEEINALKQEKLDLEAVIEETKAETEALRSELNIDDAIAEIENKKQAEVDELKVQLNEIQEKHEEELTARITEKNEEIAALQEQTLEVEKSLSSEKNETLAKLKEDHIEELKVLETEKIAQLEEMTKSIDSLKTDYENQISEMNLQFDEKISAKDEEIESITKSFENEKAQLPNVEEIVEELTATKDAQIEEQKELVDELRRVREELEEENASLKEEFVELKEKNIELRKENGEGNPNKIDKEIFDNLVLINQAIENELINLKDNSVNKEEYTKISEEHKEALAQITTLQQSLNEVSASTIAKTEFDFLKDEYLALQEKMKEKEEEIDQVNLDRKTLEEKLNTVKNDLDQYKDINVDEVKNTYNNVIPQLKADNDELLSVIKRNKDQISTLKIDLESKVSENDRLASERSEFVSAIEESKTLLTSLNAQNLDMNNALKEHEKQNLELAAKYSDVVEDKERVELEKRAIEKMLIDSENSIKQYGADLDDIANRFEKIQLEKDRSEERTLMTERKLEDTLAQLASTNDRLNAIERSESEYRLKYNEVSSKLEDLTEAYKDHSEYSEQEIEKWKNTVNELKSGYEQEVKELYKTVKASKRALTDYKLKAINDEEKILDLERSLSSHEQREMPYLKRSAGNDDLLSEIRRLKSELDDEVELETKDESLENSLEIRSSKLKELLS